MRNILENRHDHHHEDYEVFILNSSLPYKRRFETYLVLMVIFVGNKSENPISILTKVVFSSLCAYDLEKSINSFFLCLTIDMQ